MYTRSKVFLYFLLRLVLFAINIWQPLEEKLWESWWAEYNGDSIHEFTSVHDSGERWLWLCSHGEDGRGRVHVGKMSEIVFMWRWWLRSCSRGEDGWGSVHHPMWNSWPKAKLCQIVNWGSPVLAKMHLYLQKLQFFYVYSMKHWYLLGFL